MHGWLAGLQLVFRAPEQARERSSGMFRNLAGQNDMMRYMWIGLYCEVNAR